MSEGELYSTHVEVEGEKEADLNALYSFFGHDELYGDSISRSGDSVTIRTHGLLLDLYDSYFEAEIAPHARKDEEVENIATVLESEYKTDTSVLLGTGFSGGG